MKTPTICGAVLLILLWVIPPVEAQPQQRSYEGELKFDILSFGNFFQAPSEELETNVTATRIQARLGTQLHLVRPLSVYGEVGRVSYDELGSSNAFRGGLHLDGRPHAFRLSVGVETNRPTIDVGDEFDRAGVTALSGEYGYRPTREWELKGLLSVQDQGFDLSPTKDNTLFGVGGAIRYRGFGYTLSPEVGVLRGGRGAVDGNEDHSQNDFYVKVRSVLSRPLYLTFRYRHRTRDYSSDNLSTRNFGREDIRRQFTALAAIRTWEYVSWNIYYAVQASRSTLPSRTFTTQMLTVGLSIRGHS